MKKWHINQSITSKFWQAVFGLGILLFILILQATQPFFYHQILARVDGLIYDTIVRSHLKPQPTTPPVVIIDIDEKSLTTEGHWPWPRDTFASLVRELRKNGVVIMAFDIVFSEPELNDALRLNNKLAQIPNSVITNKDTIHSALKTMAPWVDNDTLFANEIHEEDTVLGFLFNQDPNLSNGQLPPPLNDDSGLIMNTKALQLHQFKGYSAPIPVLATKARHGGFVSNLPDNDGVIRRNLLIAQYKNHLYPSLALTTIMKYLMSDHVQLIHDQHHNLSGINIGGIPVPINDHGQMLIPFWGEPGTMTYVSASDVLHHKVDPKILTGAIALVGSTLILLSDYHLTPIANGFPGVELNANIIAGILSQHVSTSTPAFWDQHLGAMAGLGILIIIGLAAVNPLFIIPIFIVSVLFLLGLSIYLFQFHNIYYSITSLLFLITLESIGNFVYGFFYAQHQKHKIKNLFGQYVPPSHIKAMTEYPSRYTMDGDNREMSVFFADIRSFTTISEQLSAQKIKELLNTFFTPLTRILIEQQGTIDKYVGDMIIAFWGAPLLDPHHARHAIGAALTIQNRYPEILTLLRAHHLPEVQIGIGINTGPMNVGDMGSEYRRAYTVLGDAVNLASRLQDLTKFYHVHILVSETTRAEQDDFLFRWIDKVVVKGKKQAIIIYEPLDWITNANPLLIKELQEYEKALSVYYSKEWVKADTLFKTLQKQYPSTWIYTMYIERIEALREASLPDDWDGVFIHTHK